MSARSKTPEDKLHRYLQRIQRLVGIKNKSPSPISKMKKQKSPINIKAKNIDTYIKHQFFFKNINKLIQNYHNKLKNLFFQKMRGFQSRKAQTIYRFVAIQKQESLTKPIMNKQLATKFIIAALKNLIKISFQKIKQQNKNIEKSKIVRKDQKKAKQIDEQIIRQNQQESFIVKINRQSQTLNKKQIKTVNSLSFQREVFKLDIINLDKKINKIQKEHKVKNEQFKFKDVQQQKMTKQNDKKLEQQNKLQQDKRIKERGCELIINFTKFKLLKIKQKGLESIKTQTFRIKQTQIIRKFNEELRVSHLQIRKLNEQMSLTQKQYKLNQIKLLNTIQNYKQQKVKNDSNTKKQLSKYQKVVQSLKSQTGIIKQNSIGLIYGTLSKSSIKLLLFSFNKFRNKQLLQKQKQKSNKNRRIEKVLLKVQDKYKFIIFKAFSKNFEKARNQIKSQQESLISQIVKHNQNIANYKNVNQKRESFKNLKNLSDDLKNMEHLNKLIHYRQRQAFRKIDQYSLIRLGINSVINILTVRFNETFLTLKNYKKNNPSQFNQSFIIQNKVKSFDKMKIAFNNLQKRQLFFKIQFLSKLKFKNVLFKSVSNNSNVSYSSVVSQEVLKKQIQQFLGQRQKMKDKAHQTWKKTKSIIHDDSSLNEPFKKQKPKAISLILPKKNTTIFA